MLAIKKAERKSFPKKRIKKSKMTKVRWTPVLAAAVKNSKIAFVLSHWCLQIGVAHLWHRVAQLEQMWVLRGV